MRKAWHILILTAWLALAFAAAFWDGIRHALVKRATNGVSTGGRAFGHEDSE
jgi:hypothetical protein